MHDRSNQVGPQGSSSLTVLLKRESAPQHAADGIPVHVVRRVKRESDIRTGLVPISTMLAQIQHEQYSPATVMMRLLGAKLSTSASGA